MKKLSVIATAIIATVMSLVSPAASAQEIFPGSSVPQIQIPQINIPQINIPQFPGSSIPGSPAPAPIIPAPTRNIAADEAYWQDYNFNEVNAIRAQHGLHPLAYGQDLQNDAKAWSYTMSNGGFTGHDYEGTAAKNQAENIYWGWYDTPERANGKFMDSPGHRYNILDPTLNRLGVGVVYNTNEGKWLLTQRFD